MSESLEAYRSIDLASGAKSVCDIHLSHRCDDTATAKASHECACNDGTVTDCSHMQAALSAGIHVALYESCVSSVAIRPEARESQHTSDITSSHLSTVCQPHSQG